MRWGVNRFDPASVFSNQCDGLDMLLLFLLKTNLLQNHWPIFSFSVVINHIYYIWLTVKCLALILCQMIVTIISKPACWLDDNCIWEILPQTFILSVRPMIVGESLNVLGCVGHFTTEAIAFFHFVEDFNVSVHRLILFPMAASLMITWMSTLE